MVVPRSEYGFPWRIVTKEAPTSAITGFIVSMVTNESSVISSPVMIILFPLEFVAVIENVAFPLASLEETVVVNVASPPLVAFVNDYKGKVAKSVPSVL